MESMERDDPYTVDSPQYLAGGWLYYYLLTSKAWQHEASRPRPTKRDAIRVPNHLTCPCHMHAQRHDLTSHHLLRPLIRHVFAYPGSFYKQHIWTPYIQGCVAQHCPLLSGGHGNNACVYESRSHTVL
jgi:hypothetical protein